MDALNPWDFFASEPVKNQTERVYIYGDRINLIVDAVAEIDEEAGAFIRMIRSIKWIEVSRGDTKQPEA